MYCLYVYVFIIPLCHCVMFVCVLIPLYMLYYCEHVCVCTYISIYTIIYVHTAEDKQKECQRTARKKEYLKRALWRKNKVLEHSDDGLTIQVSVMHVNLLFLSFRSLSIHTHTYIILNWAVMILVLNQARAAKGRARLVS